MIDINIAGGPKVRIEIQNWTRFHEVQVVVTDQGPGHRGITPEQALAIAGAIEHAARQALRQAGQQGSALGKT